MQPLLEKVPGWRELDSDTAIMSDVCALPSIAQRYRWFGSRQMSWSNWRAAVRKFVLDANELLVADGAIGVQIARYQEAEKALLGLGSFAGLAARQPEEILDMPAGLDGLLES